MMIPDMIVPNKRYTVYNVFVDCEFRDKIVLDVREIWDDKRFLCDSPENHKKCLWFHTGTDVLDNITLYDWM